MLCNSNEISIDMKCILLFILVTIFVDRSAGQPTFQNCSLRSRHPCGYCRCLDDVRLPDQHYCDCRYQPPEPDCYGHYRKGNRVNGIYKIDVKELGVVEVFCDQTTDDGGWIVIQRRMDGSVDFYRNWKQYKEGFGDLQHEFWAGNEKLHKIIKQALFPFGTMMHIDLEDWSGKKRFAEYQTIQVEDESKHYAMVVGHYDGDAGDNGWGMSYHSGQPFTTYDRNNKIGIPVNCAKERKGGWWYNECATVNLNGRYFYYNKNVIPWVGIVWAPFNGHQKSLRSTEIKIRRIY